VRPWKAALNRCAAKLETDIQFFRNMLLPGLMTVPGGCKLKRFAARP
jgi:hypothetical protein